MMRVVECVSGKHCTQPFKEAVQMNPNIEHVIKYIASQWINKWVSELVCERKKLIILN